jgi:hypothetical protein
MKNSKNEMQTICLATVFAIALGSLAMAQEVTSTEQCESEAVKVENLLLKTNVSSDDLVKIASTIDQVRSECNSGNFAEAGADLAELAQLIETSTIK